MSLPEFTPDEQYLIHYVKSQKAAGPHYVWGYVIGGMILCGFAAYYDSIPMMVAAFVVVCGFRVYEEWNQSRWTPIWRSIINKFEAAALTDSVPNDDGENNT